MRNPFLFRRSGRSSYYIGFDVDGRRKQVCTDVKDISLAKQILEDFKSNPRNPRQYLKWATVTLAGPGIKETQQAQVLAERSYSILAEEAEKFVFLLKAPRKGVLAGLGRIASEQYLKTVAAEVCKLELRGKRALDFIMDARGNARRSERTFHGELRKAVLGLIRDFGMSGQEAAAYVDILLWDLKKD
jgi:hypothetical protein